MVACTSNVDEIDPITTDPDYIVLSAKALGVTRSADTDVESTLAKIDVYVMDANFNVIHSERITPASPVVGQGQFVMKKKRASFSEGAGYYVYMIANSTSATLPQANTWDDLLELTQEDKNIHLTGMSHVQDVDAPEYFLMDGFAYLSSEATTSAPKTMAPIIINDGDRTKKVELSGTLYRAAAKFILNISQGESVEFKQTLDNATPAYMLYQLPVSTLVVTPEADARYTSTKQNTKEWGPDTNFVWTTDKNGKPQITFIGYGYANDWSKELSINETALLISIPMMWDKNGISTDGKEASSPVNWYKIPLSEQSKFERNTCYVINVNINAIGAEEQNVPVELKDIEYVTLPWQDVKLNIGDYEARYLTLNTDLVKIYDKNFDLDQLTFTTSSPIVSIKLKDVFSHNERMGNVYDAFTALVVKEESDDLSTEIEYTTGDGVYAYYIDKFGQKIQLGTDPNFDLKDIDHSEWTKADILAREKNLYNKDGVATADQYIRAEVPAEQKRALNGNIHIYSPIYADATNDDLNWNSHFNTVRYLEFEVRNEQGLTATFRVEQSPLTVISNKEGFFSYRSDFCISDVPQHYNYDAFSKNFPILPMGATKPVDKYGPHHYLNPREPFWSVAVFIPYHVHECDENGTILSATCGYIDKNNTTNGELVYGLVHSSRDYYRSHGPDAGVFHRDHHFDINGNNVPNESTIKNGASKYYQAIGLPYQDKVTGKYYRRHYVGQAQATFWSKYVMGVYKEDVVDGKGNVTKRRGLADIGLQVPTEDALGKYYYVPNGGANKSLVNHRMYNVYVTTTSQEYTIAMPKLVGEDGKPTTDRSRGYTMEGAINANVVSPSFAVASQLGSTSLPVNEGGYSRPGVAGFYEYAKHQCREYVETYYEDVDGNGEYSPGDKVYHYDDWRLPTKAEIDYLVYHQKASRAMDRVLNAQYYFIASLVNDVYDESTVYSTEITDHDAAYHGHFMRCVRDAMFEPEPVVYDANHNIVSGKPVESH